MAEPASDPAKLPAGVSEDPPPDVALPMLWRVASQLYRDHPAPVPPAATCPGCGLDWPCPGRRLAARGLADTGGTVG